MAMKHTLVMLESRAGKLNGKDPIENQKLVKKLNRKIKLMKKKED